MILCVECYDELHAGKLSEKKRLGKTGEPATRKRVRLVRGERSETYSSNGARRTALTLQLFYVQSTWVEWITFYEHAHDW
jgi:hypothetical protein